MTQGLEDFDDIKHFDGVGVNERPFELLLTVRMMMDDREPRLALETRGKAHLGAPPKTRQRQMAADRQENWARNVLIGYKSFNDGGAFFLKLIGG